MAANVRASSIAATVYSWGRSNNDWNFNAPAGNLLGFGTPTGCPPTGIALCASGSDANKLNGAIGGLQAGYNWQTGNFLAGFETDFQLSSQKGNQLFDIGFPFNVGFPFTPGTGTEAAAYKETLPWLGTLRGRVGFTADHVLFYATGGLAYGRVTVDGSANGTVSFGNVCTRQICPGPAASWSNDVTKVGWTLGGGVEAAILRDEQPDPWQLDRARFGIRSERQRDCPSGRSAGPYTGCSASWSYPGTVSSTGE